MSYRNGPGPFPADLPSLPVPGQLPLLTHDPPRRTKKTSRASWRPRCLVGACRSSESTRRTMTSCGPVMRCTSRRWRRTTRTASRRTPSGCSGPGCRPAGRVNRVRHGAWPPTAHPVPPGRADRWPGGTGSSSPTWRTGTGRSWYWWCIPASGDGGSAGHWSRTRSSGPRRRSGRSSTVRRWQGAAGDAFARRLGAEPGILDARRIIDLRAVPAGRFAELKATATGHAAGYSLITWTGATPDDMLGQVAHVQNAMNDAPREEGWFEDDVLGRRPDTDARRQPGTARGAPGLRRRGGAR